MKPVSVWAKAKNLPGLRQTDTDRFYRVLSNVRGGITIKVIIKSSGRNLSGLDHGKEPAWITTNRH